jgi:hypothetical protein
MYVWLHGISYSDAVIWGAVEKKPIHYLGDMSAVTGL